MGFRQYGHDVTSNSQIQDQSISKVAPLFAPGKSPKQDNKSSCDERK